MADIPMLKHFVAVVDHGGFTHAAEQLNLSPSVVSRSVKRLEEVVGATLLERSSRSVKLTPVGRAYCEEARAVVQRLQRATETAKRMATGEAARLRVGVCPSTDAPRIARGFQTFRALWPEVDVRLSPTKGILQADALRASEIDVGIMRVDKIHGEGLDWRVIARGPLCVSVPRIWNLNKSSIRLKDLSDRPWIMPDPQVAPGQYEREVALCVAAGFTPKIAAVVSDVDSCALLLSCGVGVTISSGVNARGEGAGCEQVPLDGVPDTLTVEMAVAWAAGSTAAPVLNFVNCIVESMSRAADQA